MKKVIVLFCTLLLITSCTSIKVHKIGKLNMISNRNIDKSEDYKLIRNYMGASQDEIEKTESKTLEEAIDKTVKDTPGGEFLKNVKLYLVLKDDERFYAAEGDVWGDANYHSFRGFSAGDKVQWTSFFIKKTGKIVSLKNSKKCAIKEDESGDIILLKYDELLKISE